ncbi:hypothetical protein DSL72_000107 [Monilinia vaccinii-corymbosi]|uniref:Uncharacterized protein n=1 Tax=Monilinia vaccinii-corymbosi TaxID=61207 RepID=A0A8A3NYE5_9HELO|nr:hypothetical protein DSL72_000107 [Monilinia vaccinii-corymbosi]
MQGHLQDGNRKAEQAILQHSSPPHGRRFVDACVIRVDGSGQEHGDAACCGCHGGVERLAHENLDVADDVAGPAMGEVVGGPDDGVHGDEDEGYDVDDHEGTCGDVSDAVEEAKGDNEDEDEDYGEDGESDCVGGDGVVCSWRVWARGDDIA